MVTAVILSLVLISYMCCAVKTLYSDIQWGLQDMSDYEVVDYRVTLAYCRVMTVPH